MNIPKKRFAIIGTGYWARFQLAAWLELDRVECTALYNRTLSKAEALGREFGIEHVYDDLDSLLDQEQIDFADIITDVGTHLAFSSKCLDRGIPTICQKPLADNLETARELVQRFDSKNIPFFVHENWRWQQPIRALNAALATGRIGRPWRARIQYANSFPVFDNQPFLKELERFILMDMGTHILDTARFLFGEAQTLQCRTHRVNPDIKGEDAATVLLGMRNGMTVNVDLSYASRMKDEAFPQTYIEVEGERGSLYLGKDYKLYETVKDGTVATHHPPKAYDWADPQYALVLASIVDCNRNLLDGLSMKGSAETTGLDNLETLQLVFNAYRSAESGRIVTCGGTD